MAREIRMRVALLTCCSWHIYKISVGEEHPREQNSSSFVHPKSLCCYKIITIIVSRVFFPYNIVVVVVVIIIIVVVVDDAATPGSITRWLANKVAFSGPH